MAVNRIPLAQIRIAEPCSVSWNDMDGDDKARHCAFCNRHVHNLSAMTEDAVQDLICQTAGRLCVAFHPNADGSPKTLEYRPQTEPRWSWRTAGLLGMMGAVIAGCASYFGRSDPPAPVIVGGGMALGIMPPAGLMVMGDVAIPSTQPVVEQSESPQPLACE